MFETPVTPSRGWSAQIKDDQTASAS